MGNHVVHAILDEEDLTLLRSSAAKLKAIEANPDLYSAQDLEQAYMREFQVTGGFWKKYAIPPGAAAVMFSPISGVIIVHQD